MSQESQPKLENIRVAGQSDLPTPAELHREYPTTPHGARTVLGARKGISRSIHGRDNRLVVITGPCSIHDTQAGIVYAEKLKALAEKFPELQVVMRSYFEKPRTTVGWKGLINDPDLDGTFHIEKGLRTAREFLVTLNNEGVPVATEQLDVFTPQFTNDLVAYSAIGARSTENQGHREMASGLSTAVGFKNSTAGNVQIAVDAVVAARHPHHFIGIDMNGTAKLIPTTGNEDAHVILRGGTEPNYSPEDIADAVRRMEKVGVPAAIVVDASHGNSRKKHENQLVVAEDVARQIAEGRREIVGVMLESNLVAGRQDLVPGKPLVFGQSITDACIDIPMTEKAFEVLARAVEKRAAVGISV